MIEQYLPLYEVIKSDEGKFFLIENAKGNGFKLLDYTTGKTVAESKSINHLRPLIGNVKTIGAEKINKQESFKENCLICIGILIIIFYIYLSFGLE